MIQHATTALAQRLSPKRDRRRAGAVFIFRLAVCCLALVASASVPARAHPADEGRVDVVFRVRDGRLNWTVDWWLGNLAGLQFWSSVLDTNKDAVLSPQEKQAFAELASGGSTRWPALRLDGVAVTPRLDALSIADYTAFISLPSTPQIHAELSAPLPASSAFSLTLDFAASNGLAFIARFPAGGGVRVQDQALTRQSYGASVRVLSPSVGAPAEGAQSESATTESGGERAGTVRLWPLVAAGIGLMIAIASVMAVLSLLRRYRGRDHI